MATKPPDPGVVALLVGKMKKAAGKGGPDDAPPKPPADEGETAAAEEMLQAVRAGDAEGLAAAMKSFVRLCTGSGYDDEAAEGEG